MRNLGITIFLLVTLASCSIFNENKNELEGSWQLQDINLVSEESSFDEKATLMKTVSDGSLLSLFPDNTFTEVSGNGVYLNGKWGKRSSNEISFNSTKGKESVAFNWKPNVGHPSQLVLLNEKKNREHIYSKGAFQLANYLDDPFHVSNNSWRIKSTKSESSVELKKRLAKYFKHFALILKAAKERKQDAVYFGFSSGPIQIYSGAIGIIPFDLISENWKNTFYNETDAKNAYLIFEELLSKNKYKGSSSGNWVEDDYNIVLSLYNSLNDLKE